MKEKRGGIDFLLSLRYSSKIRQPTEVDGDEREVSDVEGIGLAEHQLRAEHERCALGTGGGLPDPLRRLDLRGRW